MKKLLTLTAVGAIFATPAMAVQKCVALNASSTTCVKSSNEVNTTEWAATCTTNDVTISIKGIGICASNSATNMGDEGRTAVLADDTTANVNCWCKIIRPVSSTWRFSHTAPYAGHCAANCASTCAAYIAAHSDFRRSILSYGLSD